MQDIRKPYFHSRSDHDLSSKVKKFESHSYDDEDYDDEEEEEIPIRSFRTRRNIDQMDMYPNRKKDGEDLRSHNHGRGDIVFRDPRTRYRDGDKTFGTLAFIFTIVVLVVGAWLFTYVFNRATVTLTPKYQDVDDFRKTITFSKDMSDNVSVGFVLATSSMEKTKSLPLSETKKVEAKASGKIVIYNNFDFEPQKLIKNTRFENPDGKIYRINQTVTVPAKKGETPGSIEVVVYADNTGAEYNIDPSDFTIPGFKGTPRYETFFARSNGPITGGSSGNISLASLSDLNSAKDELAIEMAKKIKEELSQFKREGYIPLNGAVDIIYEDNEKDVLNGMTSTYEVSATGYLMFASMTELANIVALSLRDYKGTQVRLDYTEELKFTKKDSDKIRDISSLDILVEGKPRVIRIVEENYIKGLVSGKKRNAFESIIKTVDSIKNAEIGFSPLWLSTIPDETSKINVVESLPKR